MKFFIYIWTKGGYMEKGIFTSIDINSTDKVIRLYNNKTERQLAITLTIIKRIIVKPL